MDMFIDDGNAFRRRRTDLVNQSFRKTGIATCEHSSIYGNMIVIVYAGGFEISDAGKSKVN